MIEDDWEEGRKKEKKNVAVNLTSLTVPLVPVFCQSNQTGTCDPNAVSENEYIARDELLVCLLLSQI